MTNKIVWLILSCLITLMLVAASCGPAAVEEEEEVVIEEEEEVVEEVVEEEAAAEEEALEEGIIEIRVTDPPPADVISAVVYLTEIEVHRVSGSDNGGEWISIIEFPPSFDLLDVIGVTEVLGSASVAAGSFTQIRMFVDRVEVVTADGENITAEVPSEKLKIVRPFNVEAGVKTVLILDFDGEKSLILPGKDVATGKERAKFNPVLKLLVEKEEIEVEEEAVEEVVAEIEEEEEEEEPEEIEMQITSTAFQDGETIPTRYTCDGEDISPGLSWSGAPEGTQSFGLKVVDADAPGGPFIHWVIFNIPADTTELGEAIPTSPQLPSGALQRRNSFGTIGYGGPCPPPGPAHHYHFILYALDRTLDIPAGASSEQVGNAAQGHILAEAKIIGIYQR